MSRIFLVFVISLFFYPVDVHATEVFRCGAEIVKIGDSTDTVRKLCGKPIRTESSGKSPAKKGSKKRAKTGEDTGMPGIKGKKWYYDRGYGDYVYVLTFKGNTLKKIETSGRGGK